MQGTMRRLAACLAAALALAACDGTKKATPATQDVVSDVAVTDTIQDQAVTDQAVQDVPLDVAADVSTTQDPVARGAYLVNFVMACGDCHTPRNADGSPNMAKQLAGVPNLFDLAPEDPSTGGISPLNLTPDMQTGLGKWTDAQIVTALTTGIDDEGKPLFPIMPYWLYHNLTAADANAIVAYLRSIPAVVNDLPERQPLGFPFPQAAPFLTMDQMPVSSLKAGEGGYENAQKGRYLTVIGGCVDCHTKESAPGVPLPIEVTRILAGNREFAASQFGLPTPPFPIHIFSANLTPHANGLAGWNTTQVQAAIKQGVDKEGNKLCPPMPAGPLGPFGGMTDADSLAIATYLLTIPPVDTGVVPDCKAP